MSRRARHGFTVIETLVFSSILLLLMGCIVLVVQAGMRYARKGTAYQDAQKQVLVSMRRMVEDFAAGTPVRKDPAVLNDSNYIIFASPIPDDPAAPWLYKNTSLLFQGWIAFYEDTTTEELVRVRQPFKLPLESGNVPFAPPLSDFEADPAKRILAKGVKEFSLNDGPNTNLISIKLSVGVATGTNRFTTVTSQTMAEIPNL